MTRLFTLRYRDGIGRWNSGFIQACDLAHAMTLAVMRYGSYRDLKCA
jgi:hypothetical protein